MKRDIIKINFEDEVGTYSASFQTESCVGVLNIHGVDGFRRMLHAMMDEIIIGISQKSDEIGILDGDGPEEMLRKIEEWRENAETG
jgi:uncharacterized protein YunC (DUF1805 family)